MIGATLAHYRITAALGAGGMGEVWRAEDMKLGREVALKVLPEEFSDDPQRLDRFEREARAVAALNHPHIVTIYSVEEAEGARFLTMELIEGKSLDKLIPEGGLEIEPFFDFAVPLAEAISAAHDKSVIHRDLKPSNVMVDSDGRVKVLDFGLAKLQQVDGVSDSTELPTEALTGVGMVVGTVPYMSPEQIEGKIVDHRTDVFSLGVLLYEMALGERPFQGESSPALMSSILKDAPQSVVEVRHDLPRHLGRIIGRCLEKDRRDRYQTARDVFNELKALRRESSSTGASASSSSRGENLSARTARSSSDVSAAGSIRRDEGFWIAVLPLACRSEDPSVEALAGGLTEDIVTGLSRFSYLRVISRSSTSRFAGQTIDVREVGEELGARYVMEGSIRQAGSVLRVAVQLVDTESGAHLWAETYNRPFSQDGIFELQDDLAPRIVSTVADMNGVLPRTMSETIRSRPVDELSPYEAMLRGFGYYMQLAAEDHLVGRACLEHAVADDPGNGDCWALLAMMYAEEHKHGFNAQPNSLDRALEAARKAVSIAPSNHLAHHVLAEALFFRRELQAFQIAAERAIALNPMDGCTTAYMGVLMAYTGRWDEGCALAERAMQLNPHHPGWYRFSIFLNAYRKKDYSGALDVALKISMPTYYFTHASLASVYGQLGDRTAAAQAVRELLALKPDFGTTAREEWGRWTGPGELLDDLVDGLRKAGLDADSAAGDAAELRPSGAEAAAEVPGSVAIAVLPFTDMSPDKDQDYFCEGMAEEIMNALVHVDGIRVASRTSAFKVMEKGGDLKTIGKALSVGQVLEGSVRLAGNRLRVTAQLTEVEGGYQLWSERYDREVDDVFAVQDEIAAGVVKAVTARMGAVEQTVPSRAQVGNLEAYQLYLKGRHYRYSKNDHANALKCFEEAVAIDPDHAPSWVGRAEVTILAAVYSLIPIREGYQTAKDSLATAMHLQGESAEGCYVEGMIAFCEMRWRDAEKALRRAVKLQPTFVQAHCWFGFLFSVLRHHEEAESAFATARELDPLAAYPYGMTACGRITLGRPREAIDDAGQAIVFDHDNTLALWCSGIAKVATRRFDEGIEELETAVRYSRRGAFILGIFGWSLAAAGRIEAAEAILEELKSRPKPAPTVVSEAWTRAALGDIEGAWEVLGRAEEEYQAILYFAGMPPFDPLRSDPRFDEMLERLGLPPSPSAQRGSSPVEANKIADKSIAVLPFVNRSGDADDEYFSDGLSEELINALSRVPDLKVTARSSAFQFRGQELDVRDVGRKLGVATVLEGSVRISGSRLRITTELVNCADGYQIWSERFDREITDIFDTQEEIAGAIVEQLHVGLGGTDKDLLVATRTENMDAYRLFLKGRYLRHTKNDHGGALQSYEEAVRLDPLHGPSWVGVAEVTVLATFYGLLPTDAAYEKARDCLATAAEIQGENGEACYVEGLLAFFEQRWADWEAARLRAFELEPHNIQALGSFGMFLCIRERLAEAMVLFDRAREIDPLSAFALAATGMGLLTCGKLEECGQYFDKALAIEEENTLALWGSGIATVTSGRLEEGVALLERAADHTRRAGVILGILGWAYAVAGRADDARKTLDEIRSRPEGSPTAMTEGWLLAALGRMDEAWDVFSRAMEEKQGFLGFLGFPPFAQFHGDRRWHELRVTLGLEKPADASHVDDVSDVVSPEDKSIAVLPFTNMSADPENEYFSDGLTEEIISDLSKIGALRVISRTSAMQFKGAKKNVQTIGRELGVRYVLEGGVRKAGSSLRITAQLIDAETDAHLWSEKYRGTMDDVFEVQERVSREIVRALDVTLTSDENRRLAERPIADVRAFELYLQARQEIRRFDVNALERAAKLLSQAVEIEGETPPLLNVMAYAKVAQVKAGGIPDLKQLDEAEAQALALLEQTPDLPQAHALLGSIAYERGRQPQAVWHCRRALEGNSNDADALLYLGAAYMAAGQEEEGLDAGRRMVACDPLASISWMILGAAYWFVDRAEEALPDLERSLELDPQNLLSHWAIGYTYATLGRLAEAGRHAAFLHENGPENPYGLQLLSLVEGLQGRQKAALQVLADVDLTPLDPHTIFHFSESFAMAGDTGRALAVLELAVDLGFYPYPFINEYCPFMAPLRSLPGFAPILAKSREKTESFREEGPLRPSAHDDPGGTT